MSQKEIITALKILAAALLFTPFLTGGSIAFFNLRQLVFFRIIVEISFVLYLYLIFKNPSHKPKNSFLLTAIVVLVSYPDP